MLAPSRSSIAGRMGATSATPNSQLDPSSGSRSMSFAAGNPGSHRRKTGDNSIPIVFAEGRARSAADWSRSSAIMCTRCVKLYCRCRLPATQTLREVVPSPRRLAVLVIVGISRVTQELMKFKQRHALGLAVVPLEIRRARHTPEPASTQSVLGGCALCTCRRANDQPKGSHQYRSAVARLPTHGIRRSSRWRADVLWSKSPDMSRRPRRQNIARLKARRHPGRATDQVLFASTSSQPGRLASKFRPRSSGLDEVIE